MLANVHFDPRPSPQMGLSDDPEPLPHRFADNSLLALRPLCHQELQIRPTAKLAAKRGGEHAGLSFVVRDT